MIFPIRRKNLGFRFETDLSGASGADTSKGVCKINGADVSCIRKVYKDDDMETSFKTAASKIDKYRGIMEEFGPKIYHVDRKNRTVYMEYINCVTLEEYMTKMIDPWTKEGFQCLKAVMNNVGDTMKALHSRGVCHTDPNLGNLLVCLDDKSIKIIDYDEMKDADGDCVDMESIQGHMLDALDDNIIVRRNKMNATFEAQAKSIGDILMAADTSKHFFDA